MNEQQFASGFATVISILGDMSRAVGENASLLGCFSIEDYQLFQNLIKEMAWFGRV